MSVNGWRVADSDMHVMEPADLWERYIAPGVAPRGADRALRAAPRHAGAREGHSLTRVGRGEAELRRDRRLEARTDYALAASEARLWDPKSQLAAMDDEGLDVAVLFPSRGLFVLGLDTTEQVGPDGLEPALAAAIARAYNDWLHDFCGEEPTRLFGAGLLAPHDVDLAVDEVQRCVETLGFATVFMLPGLVNGRAWHDPAYDPIWPECERLGVPSASTAAARTTSGPTTRSSSTTS